jgi:hypothetical protein
MSCHTGFPRVVSATIVVIVLCLAGWPASPALGQAVDPGGPSTPANRPMAGAAPDSIPSAGGPGYYAQMALALQPWPNQNVPYAFEGAALHNPDAISHTYVAPVALPNGATVTRFVVWFVDKDSHTLDAYLSRYALDISMIGTMASVVSAGAADSVRYAQDTTIADATVDLESNAYFIQVGLPPTSNVSVVSFRIDYEYAAHLPAVLK